jgi:ABC-type histidine transport system ATPase subunit
MAILEVKNLNKSFGSNHVLKGIDFTLEEGKVLSVIGSSGSGKTTLLRCITSLETADKGLIKVNGNIVFDSENQHKFTKEEIRQNRLAVGLVFQSFNLFPQYTVLKNVTLACELQAKKRSDWRSNKKQILEEINANAKDILAKVGLSEKLDSYPCHRLPAAAPANRTGHRAPPAPEAGKNLPNWRHSAEIPPEDRRRTAAKYVSSDPPSTCAESAAPAGHRSQG